MFLLRYMKLKMIQILMKNPAQIVFSYSDLKISHSYTTYFNITLRRE